MLHFDSDYLEGAHPAVLERLAATNLAQTPGYGADSHCERARGLIRAACDAPDAAVYFLVGGTQANAAVLDQLLKPWEGVVAADTGHINVHEAGAVEACGHKVIALPGRDGKLQAGDLHAWCSAFWADETREHMVAPGVAYISHPTELGTLYTKAELAALSAACREFGMRLFLDGARLGYGLAAEGTDVTLPDVARCCDAFTIGGTKVGALFGEAVVFPRPADGGATPLDAHFFTLMKRHGAVLAKGRVLGIQFEVLFEDGLYGRLGGHAVGLARRLAEGLRAKGYRLACESPTNQQFVVLDAAALERLRGQATFEVWERRSDGGAVVRLVTSWATRPEAIDDLLAAL